jgi:hypothetical protein
LIKKSTIDDSPELNWLAMSFKKFFSCMLFLY